MSPADASALTEARAAYPVFRHTAFLNAGTFGPLSQGTMDAFSAAATEELERGRGGMPYYARVKDARVRVRTGIAELIGVDPANVALTYSTTSACQIVLGGLGLTPDDDVVTTDEEHFGLLGPLHVSGARVTVAATRGKPADQAVAAILDAVGARTRLIAVSHVSWLTGNILPVAEVKAATGLPLLVDGAQSAGAIPVEARAFDFYTISGQKWLCGPDATGALYVADPEGLRLTLPSYWSRSEHGLDGAFDPIAGAARFDPGTIPHASLAGLDVALADPPPWRFGAAAAMATRCRELLAQRYDVITRPEQATLVTFRPDGDAAETAARLFDAGVVVRDLPGTPWVRVSCGYWTSEGDLERLLAAL